MFAVQCGEALFGPFKTADAAAKWADKRLASSARWIIRPLLSTKQ
jgi:hypothetical protein